MQILTMMKQKNNISILVLLIVMAGALVTLLGIFSDGGTGSYLYESIRGQTIEIYGKGIYRHMSADVAIQGIAQDYVTLFIGIPLLLISLIAYRKGSKRGHFILAGTLGYFFVTYLFYTAMGMYNIMFTGYVALMGLSFFALFQTVAAFDFAGIISAFSGQVPARLTGWFLVIDSILIALLWLSIIIPPLAEGTIYPPQLQHYTTLIVQGFDLGLLLPLSFVSGILLMRRRPTGYVYGTVYIIFLSILMSALSAKIIAMALHGVNVVPAVFIIPALNAFTIICAVLMVKSVKKTWPA